MPQKNAIKNFKNNSFHHIYNRGVDKREIFYTEQDYEYFIGLIKNLLQKESVIKNKDGSIKEVIPNKSYMGDKIELYAFCLMPNHFHLVLKQIKKRAITRFMRSLSTSYVMHFNKKYNRSGRLFEGTYRAVAIKTQEQFQNVLEYVHDNPKLLVQDSKNYRWSSKRIHSNKQILEWLKILG